MIPVRAAGIAPGRPRRGGVPARWRAVLALAVGAALLASGLVAAPTASAHHAEIATSRPERGARLSEAPSEVAAWFNLPLMVPGSGLAVTDPSGRRYDTGGTRHAPDDPTELVVGLRPLPPGTYTVTWRVMAEFDQDYNQGNFDFTVVENDADRLVRVARREGVLTLALGLIVVGTIYATRPEPTG